MKDQIFVSYSRDQLYYAESVAHTLQEQNFHIWFDLQQLAPGTTWADEIESGLREASRIILIASRSSLRSPYVAIEWMHALETGKPVYIVLFEEVEFKTFTAELNGETMRVPLEALQGKAQAIIDGRGNFRKSMQRLGESLAGTAIHKDPVPSVNRFRIPRRLPLPVAFIAGTMAALTLLTLVLTFTIFSTFLPMTLVGIIATAHCGLQTWEFLQRTSYQGARVVLTIAPVFAYLFAVWFTPVAIAALYFAIYSDDVHRWSPLGEGNNPRDLILKRKQPLWQQILPFFILVPLLFWQPGILWLILIVWFFVRNRNIYETHRRGDTVIGLLILSTLLLLIDSILALPFILTLAVIANRRQQPIARANSTGSVPYMLHAGPEDAHIVEDINNALEYVGLKRLHPSGQALPPDYHIVVISNFGELPKIDELKTKGGKIVVVLASSLADWERVKEYSDYQWVDYRRQDPERLIAMARDLEAGKQSNSFNTRIVPESFERPVIPRRVFLFTLVQLLFYSVAIFKMTRSLVTGEDVNLGWLIFGGLSLAVSFWIVEKILERRITILRMTQINLAMAFALNLLVLIVGLVEPRPPGTTINTTAILALLLLNVVSILIFYRLGMYQMSTIMKWWLPPDVPPGRGRRNRQLLQTTFVAGLVTILLTVSFFGTNIPVSHAKVLPTQVTYRPVDLMNGLSLDVPEHWLQTPAGIRDHEITPYVLHAPLSAVLVKADGPLNKGLAVAINSYFQSPFASQSLIIGYLYSLGGKIESTFTMISFALDPNSVPWQPENYGSPIFTTAYVPEGKVEDTLILTVWLYRADTPFISSVGSVVANAPTAPNTQPAEENILPANIAGFDREVTAIQFKDDPGKTVIVAALDTSGSDYYVTVSGPSQLLRENSSVLEHILESIAK
jgi:hypothetical protein